MLGNAATPVTLATTNCIVWPLSPSNKRRPLASLGSRQPDGDVLAG